MLTPTNTPALKRLSLLFLLVLLPPILMLMPLTGLAIAKTPAVLPPDNELDVAFDLLNEPTTEMLFFGFNDYDLAWGDIDGDDQLDLVVSVVGSNHPITRGVHIYRNDNGSLHLIQQIELDTDFNYISLGDMDGDSDLDLAVGQYIYENIDGHFVPYWTLGHNIWGWLDWNGDGYLDLDTAGGVYQNALFDSNHSQPFFLAIPFVETSPWAGRNRAWGDWDGDGDLDVAMFHGPTQRIRIMENTGTDLVFDPANGFGAEINILEQYPESVTLRWGDLNNDGYLDLVASIMYGGGWCPATNIVTYINTGNTMELAWTGGAICNIYDIEVADWNLDGLVDIILPGYVTDIYDEEGRPISIFLNQEDETFDVGWVSPDQQKTRAVAVADWDGDGDLDLAVVNKDGYGAIYINDTITPNSFVVQNEYNREMPNHCEPPEPWWNYEVYADIDNDGDLDKGVLWGHLVTIYENREDVLVEIYQYQLQGPAEIGIEMFWTNLDFDESLDLAIIELDPQNPGIGGRVTILRNEANLFYPLPSIGGVSLAFADFNLDDSIDIAYATHGWTEAPPQRDHIVNYANGGFHHIWSSSMTAFSSRVGWRDLNNSGSVDLTINSGSQTQQLYENRNGLLSLATHQAVFISDSSRTSLANANPILRVDHPLPLDCSQYPLDRSHISAKVFTETVIPLTYWLYDRESDPIGRIEVSYTFDGGETWYPAVATSETVTQNLATRPYGEGTGENQHTFYWDTFASGLFGLANNLVLRFEAFPQVQTALPPGSMRYYNSMPPAVQFAPPVMTTYPFRVRGTQVHVFTNTVGTSNGVAEAVVYRLPAGASSGGAVMGTEHEPYRTDAAGFLVGRGEIGLGDQLMAMVPITSSYQYTLYHTSAAPTVDGLDMYTVTAPGVQQLVVSPDNKLILFNLLVSLEWDARHDPTYLTQLENDLRRTSQILFDMSNGQAALGDVRVYHDKGYWGEADITIRASNRIRPSAILGGVVMTPTSDIGVTGVLTDAYFPGQVSMGATWNRFGNPSGTVGEDWPRTLAHELGHYLFFLPDNYLGLNEDGFLAVIDCPGTVMSDPYSNTELATAAEWTGSCTQTLAEIYLGRHDWQTVNQFYPITATTRFDGPYNIPLAVTNIEFMAPVTPTTTIADPFFRVVNGDNNNAPLVLGAGQVGGYLLKRADPTDPTDDYLIPLGTPVGDLLQARGVSPGDQLCLFQYRAEATDVGCIDHVTNANAPLVMYEQLGWTPDIRVTPITTSTLLITVTNVTATELSAQLLPAMGHASTIEPMIPVGNGVFTQTLTAPDGAYYGYMQVWNPSSPTPQMSVVEFLALEDWGGRRLAWGGRRLAWGGRRLAWGGRRLAWGVPALSWGGRRLAWGAPVMSNDGQVSVFPLDDLFSSNQDFALQKLTRPPNLPSWLVPVGQAYRLQAEAEALPRSSILFFYMSQEVPVGQEAYLELYYSPDEGQSWERLETALDTYRNHASAEVAGDGIYVLVATIEVAPGFVTGWNTFGYAVQSTRPISTALASIAGKYTAVAHYDPSQPDPWLTHYVTVTAPFGSEVNTLNDLRYNRAYWLHATEPITLYLAPETNMTIQMDSIAPPPATFYGWITPTVDFNPIAGMPVTAWVGEQQCGATVVQSDSNGRLYYVLQVEGAAVFPQTTACGQEGRPVRFRVGPWLMSVEPAWDNRVAHHQALTVSLWPVEGLVGSGSTPTLLGNVTTFEATVSGGTDVNFEWDFGDGSMGAGAMVTHTYGSVGVYTAVVTAYNSINTVSVSTTIEIIDNKMFLPMVSTPLISPGD